MCGVIVVDAGRSRSTCFGCDAYIHDHDNVIIIRFSINSSTVICSPTVILMLSREASSETYGPRVYLLSYLLSIYLYLHLYFLHLYYKIPKIYYYLSIRSHFARGREGIDNPFIALVASSQFVCVGAWDFWGASYWIDTLVLKNWGKYLRYCAASPFPLQGKPTQAQDIARRISGAIAGEVFAQVKTYQVPITNSSPSHYIICHLPLVFLSPTSPLPFYSRSLSICRPLSLSPRFFCCYVWNWGDYCWYGQ